MFGDQHQLDVSEGLHSFEGTAVQCERATVPDSLPQLQADDAAKVLALEYGE